MNPSNLPRIPTANLSSQDIVAVTEVSTGRQYHATIGQLLGQETPVSGVEIPVEPGTGVGSGIAAYTWATKPAANTVPAGTLIQITGATLRGLWESDGTYWRYYKAVSLLANGNPGTTTVGTAETVLAAIPLPAGCMADVGKMVVEAVFSFPNNANTKEIQLRVGGTGITGTSLSLNNFTTTQKQAIRMGFMNRNLVNSQVQTSLEYTSGYGGTTPAILTAAVDTSVDQTVYVTARCVVGTDTITLQALDANLV